MLTHERMVAAIASDLARYASEAADRITGFDDLAGLLDLEAADLDRAMALRVVTDPAVMTMLDDVEAIIPTLPPAQRRVWTESRGVLRGQVSWQRTQERRVATGDRTVFVTNLPERRYDTNLARLVRLWLETFLSVSHRARTIRTEAAAGSDRYDAASNARRAQRLLSHPKLVSIVKSLRDQELEDLSRRERLSPLVEFVRDMKGVFDRRDPLRMASLMQSAVFTPASTPSLFELYVGFRLVEAFERAGLHRRSPRRLLGGTTALSNLSSSNFDVDVYWQCSIWRFADADHGSAHRLAGQNGAKTGMLRPDLVIVLSTTQRKFVRFVEIKYYREPQAGVSAGLLDALGYLKDAEDLYSGDNAFPLGLVIASGATTEPTSAEVAIGSERQVDQLVELLIRSTE